MRLYPEWFWHILRVPAWYLSRQGKKTFAIRGDGWSALYRRYKD